MSRTIPEIDLSLHNAWNISFLSLLMTVPAAAAATSWSLGLPCLPISGMSSSISANSSSPNTRIDSDQFRKSPGPKLIRPSRACHSGPGMPLAFPPRTPRHQPRSSYIACIAQGADAIASASTSLRSIKSPKPVTLRLSRTAELAIKPATPEI